MSFLSDGLTYAVGTSTGQVLLYDLRSTRPLLLKDHHNEYPIKNIEFLADNQNIMSADTKTMKFWNRNTVRPLIKIFIVTVY
jgi:ribosome biogenesis protein ENP2